MTPELSALTWPQHTARLTLRPVTLEDHDATWTYRRLPAVSQWITVHPATEEEHRTTFFTPERLANCLAIVLDGEVVGDLMIDVQDAWGQREVKDGTLRTQAELGWTLHPDHGGHGYATEAIEAALAIAFDQLGLRRVTALCFADNAPSWRLMERLGMRREAHNVADSLHRDLGWCDGFGYALLADEWRERRGHGVDSASDESSS